MKRVSGSFRDPSGFVFEKENCFFRAINQSYQYEFENFISSGLCEKLRHQQLLIPFYDESGNHYTAWKTIRLEKIPFISYPYEWAFEQLKDAAITTLHIQLEALDHGMSLKDASAYNIQFWRGKPTLIDHLSFELAEHGKPWSAYRQFVMHFLGPLALMAKSDTRHALHLRNFIDGLPLDYISHALPLTSWLNPSFFIHIHLHAKFQKNFSNTKSSSHRHGKSRLNRAGISSKTLKNLAYSLLAAVEKLRLPSYLDTEWGNYYEETNYTQKSFSFKKDVVNQVCERYHPRRVCDLGANDGKFSRIAAENSELVISADVDPVAVNKNYQNARNNDLIQLLPVLQDLCNPSPALGWANEERSSFLDRAHSDFVMGLALVHHLCIGNNLPLTHVARLFYSIAPVALIEFVPKEDSQVQRLLASREDIFTEYTIDNCIRAFRAHYRSVERIEIPDSCRTLLLFNK
jgi:hypothetical protein